MNGKTYLVPILRSLCKMGSHFAFTILLIAGCAAAHKESAPDNFSYTSTSLKERTDYSLRQAPKPGQFEIPDWVKLDDGLSQDEAVAVALWNNARFQADLAALGFARADLIEAKMLPNPVFSLLFPIGPKLLEADLNIPIDALWQRPNRIAAAKLDARTVSENLVQDGLGLIRDVQTTYADLWLAQEWVQFAKEDIQLRAQMAGLAKAQFKAGDISGLVASEAHVNSLEAVDAASTSSKEVVILKHRLNTLLGIVSNDVQYDILPLEATVRKDVSIDELLKMALAARPDLRGAELEIEAAGKRLGWEKSKVYNFIAIIDGKDEGSHTLWIGPGLEAEVPLFNQNQGGIARARAEMEQAARQYEAVRQNIMLQVRQAYTEYVSAHERFDLWNNQIVPSLTKTLDEMQKSLAAGEVPYLSVLQAREKLVEARMREAELAANLYRSVAQLDYSIGRRMI
jgi:cobalt-zinc-cadmium efflux system outer membrane protein